MAKRRTKTAEVKPLIGPAILKVGSPDTEQNKVASKSKISAASDSGIVDTPNPPASVPLRCLSREEIKEQNQKRQIEFPTRTAGLNELANTEIDLAKAAIKYCSNLHLLCDDLVLIKTILEHTLDDPSDSMHYSVDSHEWLLKQSALALNGLANVIDIMEPQLRVPVKTTELRRIASHLYFIIDPDVKFSHTKATEQHWAEVELAESGLCDLKEQIENLKAFVEFREVSVRDSGSGGVEPNDSSGIGMLPSNVGVLSIRPQETVVQRACHSEDFRCVNWYGMEYIFTPGQAGAVQHLWHAWESGIPSCSSVAIIDATGGDSKRVRDIFKGTETHPAWGTMIRKQGRDMFFLLPPESSENPT